MNTPFALALKYMTPFVRTSFSTNKVQTHRKISKWDLYFHLTFLLWMDITFPTVIVPLFVKARLHDPVSDVFKYGLLAALFLFALSTVITGVNSGFFKDLEAEADAMTLEEHKLRRKKSLGKFLLYYILPIVIPVAICVFIQEFILVDF